MTPLVHHVYIDERKYCQNRFFFCQNWAAIPFLGASLLGRSCPQFLGMTTAFTNTSSPELPHSLNKYIAYALGQEIKFSNNFFQALFPIVTSSKAADLTSRCCRMGFYQVRVLWFNFLSIISNFLSSLTNFLSSLTKTTRAKRQNLQNFNSFWI